MHSSLDWSLTVRREVRQAITAGIIREQVLLGIEWDCEVIRRVDIERENKDGKTEDRKSHRDLENPHIYRQSGGESNGKCD